MSYAEVLYQVFSTITEEYAKREQAKEDKQRADQIIGEVSNRIDKAKNEILAYLDEHKDADLRGKINGLTINWRTYQSEHLKSRILDIMSMTNTILGTLKSHINSNLDVEFRIKTFPRYFIVTGMKSVIWSEYKYRYVSDTQTRQNYTNEIREMWNEALDYWPKMKDIMYAEHVKRFSGPNDRFKETSYENCDGYNTVYYVKDGKEIIVREVEAYGKKLGGAGGSKGEHTCVYEWGSPSKNTVYKEATDKLIHDVNLTFDTENRDFNKAKERIEMVKDI